jgi:hypothetical protein
MRKPDFIIVGAHKAGTTSLHYYLDEHPDIYLPDYKGGDLLSHRDFKQLGKTQAYLDQFAQAGPGQVLGEVSSVYFHQDDQFVEQLSHTFPDLKIIVILRDPVDRAYSHAFWDRSYSQQELQNFDDLVLSSKKILRPGLYATHLKKYLRCFGEDQVKTFLYDDLRQDSREFVTNMYAFLGVKSDFEPDVNKRYHSGNVKIDNSYNKLLKRGKALSPTLRALVPAPMRSFLRNALISKSTAPKPKMSSQLRHELMQYYRDEVMELEGLTGLKVSRWVATAEK